MGIPRFFVWLKKQNYPGVLQNSLPGDVDWLIFDTNSLFHQAHQITYAYGDHFNKDRAQLIRTISPERLESEFRNTLITLLMTIINRVRPTKGILIAVDGVAPQAKIQQQRQRRYKGPRTSDNDEEEDTPELAELRKPIVDPNRITPGTDFMFRLDDFLRTWFKNPKNILQIGVQKIIYSSHLVPGEGEHKYLELLRSGHIPTTGVHVIHGMDADLFILSLVAPVERIYITREDINQVVSIQNFRHTLHRLMKNETTPTDFALMTFFIGNDFLPHQPSLLDMEKGINALISAYAQVGKPLTTKTEKGHSIIWENLEEFLKVMAANEGALLANEAIEGFKYPSPPFEQSLEVTVVQKTSTDTEERAKSFPTQKAVKKSYIFHYDTFRDYWYQHALGPRGDTSILEFLMGREIYPVSIDRIVEQNLSYLRGLAWNLVYYMDGWNRASLEYVYPYHQTPLFGDLVSVLAAQLGNDPILNEGIFQEPDYVYNFNPIHQLLAVLPFESQELLPPEVKDLMNIDSPIYDMFPNQFLIDRVGTNRKWEGLPLMPYAESDRIIAAVKNVPFPEKRWKRYQAGKDFVVTLSEQQVDIIRKQREQLAKVQQLFPSRRGRTRSRREEEKPPSHQTKTQKQEEWRSAKIFL
jgi:5'-3' exonuclease